MFRWTEDNLAIREDSLWSWRWLPDAEVAVPDRNDATDGDLFDAWALTRAGIAFDRRDYTARATRHVAYFVGNCLADSPAPGGGTLLLPAAFGFQIDGGYVVSPSYFMLRAMQQLGAAHGASRLVGCAPDGDALTADLAQSGPVPDWVQITADGTAPAKGFTYNSGYEALCIPLFPIWSARPRHPAVQAAYAPGTSRAVPGKLTAVVTAAQTGAVLETSDTPVYRARAALTKCAIQGSAGLSMPPFAPNQPYHPATLQMFSYLAQIDISPECFPI